MLWRQASKDVDVIIDQQDLKQVSDTGALEKIVDDVLVGMADQIAQYQEADDKKRKKTQENPKLFN
jgi:aspartyl-tRNA(Asn)/glutamyl-tRNA(Gln) amidotransferase subunit B